MSTSRDDSATLIIAVLFVVALLAGGVLLIGRKAASIRALAAAQQAKALEMEARVRAETARAEEESIKSAPHDQNATLREALDQAAAKLDEGSIKDPAAAASMHAALGQSYLGLGDFDAAEKHLTTALALHVKAGGEDSPEAAADRENLAKVAAARAR